MQVIHIVPMSYSADFFVLNSIQPKTLQQQLQTADHIHVERIYMYCIVWSMNFPFIGMMLKTNLLRLIYSRGREDISNAVPLQDTKEFEDYSMHNFSVFYVN